MPELPPQHKSIEDIMTAITQITTMQSQSFQEFARTVRTTGDYTLMRTTIASAIITQLGPFNLETFDKEALSFYTGVLQTTAIMHSPESVKVSLKVLAQECDWSEKKIGKLGTELFRGVQQIQRSFEVDPTGISYLSSVLAETEKNPELKEPGFIKGIRFLKEVYETTVNNVLNP